MSPNGKRVGHLWLAACALTLAGSRVAQAQKVTTVPELTARQVLSQMVDPLGSAAAGEAIALPIAVEIGTFPLGTSSGGFVFKLDPSTGLQSRTTTTFGPSFAERALTLGEGKISMGATFAAATYDKLGDFSLSNLPIGTVSGTAAATRTGTANLRVTSRTLALSGFVGVNDRLDVGVIVPLVSLKLAGTSALTNSAGVVSRLAQTDGIFSGVGDVEAVGKYRIFKFPGGDHPDPGGAAMVVNMRLPTGDRDNLRGLGVTRTMVSGIISAGTGRIRPHGSAGFEYWNKSLDVATGLGADTVSVRHQVQYAAGIEVEASPKITLLVDFLGQHVNGAGQVDFLDSPNVVPGASSTQSLVALGEGIRKAVLVPGIKVNLKGKLLLSLSALITLQNNGLHPKVTPVVGLNLSK